MNFEVKNGFFSDSPVFDSVKNLLGFFQEEDEECRVFAAAKRNMMRLRAEKEKHLHE